MPVSKTAKTHIKAAAVLSAAFAILTSTSLVGPSPAQAGYDCAHGPDTYRVRGVADWDTLNMRSRPRARSRIVGRISAYGSGVHCLGPCKGKWCRVSWRGIVGWVNMKYLGE
ncbi:MAG: SH3 domain-containing protein [Alphaproteobacteria bacterium]|nr:SH3 domain-containing protein [Alphaproteobacteria bacterium]